MKGLVKLAAELQALYEQSQRAREARRVAGERMLGKAPSSVRPNHPSGGLSLVRVRIRST